MQNWSVSKKLQSYGGTEFLDFFVTAANTSVTDTLIVSLLFNLIPENANKTLGKNTNSGLVDDMYTRLPKELNTISWKNLEINSLGWLISKFYKLIASYVATTS